MADYDRGAVVIVFLAICVLYSRLVGTNAHILLRFENGRSVPALGAIFGGHRVVSLLFTHTVLKWGMLRL